MGVDRGDAVPAPVAAQRGAAARGSARLRGGRAGRAAGVKVSFWPTAWEDYRHWQAHDAKLPAKLNALIEEGGRNRFKGTVKPEPLAGNLRGCGARRVTH